AGLPADEFAVFKGNGSIATITGLMYGNTYYFTTYSRVGTSWTAGVSTSITVDNTVPDVSSFTTYNDCGAIKLSCLLPECYNDVLVVARNASAVTASPTGDGSSFTANPVFGTGGSGANLPTNEYAVYRGSGTSATITGLTNENTYYFEIFVRIGTEWSAGNTVSATSVSASASGPTTFIPGDLVFVGFDSFVGGANDRYSILNLVDIGPGTEFILANLLYEWNDPAATSSGKWYNCAVDFSTPPP